MPDDQTASAVDPAAVAELADQIAATTTANRGAKRGERDAAKLAKSLDPASMGSVLEFIQAIGRAAGGCWDGETAPTLEGDLIRATFTYATPDGREHSHGWGIDKSEIFHWKHDRDEALPDRITREWTARRRRVLAKHAQALDLFKQQVEAAERRELRKLGPVSRVKATKQREKS